LLRRVFSIKIQAPTGNFDEVAQECYEVAQVLEEVAQLAIIWSFSLKLVVHGLVAIIR